MMKAVLDTNVFLSALRSQRGASFEILQLLREGKWQMVLSNHLAHEYEEVGKLNAAELGLTAADVDDVLDALCRAAEQHPLSQGWRPVLHDPDDEPLVQLAVESGAGRIVTHNLRHLRPARRFGIVVQTPRDFF
jgi:putative PIN family toxin of toxin-antitoxin system